ncbi:tigger transposable element-derived protein 4-like [Stegodyphus dumicola]|uniref:tigger transposable element-derived protein 4-like n=1 Tax=Stegodyphus dumicola TaxID=202533 RepID=UPI0015ABCCC2|nr:tigger transposable element-derived protein 4-like [Stegodyphus dumicola]XP_035207904.1 tigger transposable element-derived protein 4-like [Stegodyphus dumicola]XP_035207905.1 tigger transposable element-derived protein 4-like [Stegodyphus dumicola]XP_035207906.1 tigger transposable element-derived protein 4-like [Stegodyphus dumicola]XP_035207907.1 tigger transposable element-derived protein 4-like [Stegodyphus dumicola]XP_035207908.1 tigger transposable element-derived protein 4-like [Ste
MSKRKLKILTVEEKVLLIREVEDNPSIKKKDLAVKYGIPPNTLSTILSNKEKILEHFSKSGTNLLCKKIKVCGFPDVEQALLTWFENHHKFNTEFPVDGALLREKALEFGKILGHPDFMASNGWLERFKSRHNIYFQNMFGEAKQHPESVGEVWRQQILDRLLAGYNASSVFNLDETGLFFKYIPNKIVMCKEKSHSNRTLNTDQLTILVGANADGSEKLPLLLIGKSKTPRCFKDVKSFPLEYRSNKNAWMTSTIFEDYVRKLDLVFHYKQRKVLFLVDDCPAHRELKNLKAIQIEFLPPFMTRKLQPTNQIIRNLKIYYRRQLIRKIINKIKTHGSPVPSVSVLDAMWLISRAWNNDVSQECIASCFKKCGFFSPYFFSVKNEFQNEENLDIAVAPEILEIPSESPMNFSDYVSIDEELKTCEGSSDEEIVPDVKGCEHDSEDEHEDLKSNEEPVLTNKNVSNALSLIQHYIESCENVPVEMFRLFDKLSDFVTKEILKSES